MKYIIVELIPEAVSPDKGNLIQLSALKLNDLELIDRFDYRLNEDKVKNKSFIEMFNYDKESFMYLNSTEEILDKFKEWSSELPLYIMDNEYTNNFLKNFNNKKESIFEKLNIEYTDDVIDKIIEKYQLQPSNYIVDILYEDLIYESNNSVK